MALTKISGEIIQDNVVIAGILTATNLKSQQLSVTGISTVGSLSIGNTSVISTGRQLQNIVSLDATTTSTIESAVANAPNTFSDLSVSGISTLGVTSATNLTAQQLNVSGISTLGVTTATNLTSQSLNVSGVTTTATLKATSIIGVTTAGITTAYISAINDGPIAGTRNRIINGDMRIDQRNNGAAVTPTVNGTYVIDRWISVLHQVSKYSVQRNAGSVTPPVGFTNYLGVTSLSAYSVLSSDLFWIDQRIEGFNAADFSWGTANAKTVTLSFWIRSSLTGTFGGNLSNDKVSQRSYPYSYTISSANTWEYKTITIPGDTTGTWGTDNSSGILVAFNLGAGSTYSGTAGAWTATNIVPTGATSVVGTNGATFYITGVQLEPGTVATPFERRSYGAELALCQRYFQSMSLFVSSVGGYPYTFSAAKRSAPTVSAVAAGFSLASVTPTVDNFWCSQTTGSTITVIANSEL